MQTQNLSRPFFKKALSRLRSLVNLGDAKDRICYELKQELRNTKHNNPGLSKELEATISTLDRVITGELLEKPMDRRRAEEYTAQILTGKSYPLLATQLTNSENTGKDTTPFIDNLFELSQKMVRISRDMKLYKNKRASILDSLKANLDKFNVDDKTISHIDDFSPTLTMDSIAGYLHRLFLSSVVCDNSHIEVVGIEEACISHNGKDAYQVNVKIINGNHVFSVDFEYKNSEYETWDEFMTEVYLDGVSLTELIDGDIRSDGNYLIDELNEFLFKWFTQEFQFDDQDVSNPFCEKRKGIYNAVLAASSV